MSTPAVTEVLVSLASSLGEKLHAVSEEMSETDYATLNSASYEFDAGFTAGLRVALNEIAHLTSKLTKNPDE